MAATFVFFIASALLVQNAFSQCINNGIGLASGIGLVSPGINTIGNVGLYGGVGAVGAGLGNVYSPTLLGYPNLGAIGSSGPLAVSTISPIGPSGLAVASENTIEGILQVSGTLPFLSAVAFEGALPTAGSGVATCGCGNGAVGILSEGFSGAYPGPFPGPYPGAFPGAYPAALPGYATIGTGFGGLYY